MQSLAFFGILPHKSPESYPGVSLHPESPLAQETAGRCVGIAPIHITLSMTASSIKLLNVSIQT